MISFAYPDQAPLAFEVAQSVALDNGAFTEWLRGHKPNWDEYAQWISEWHKHPGFDWCLIPDVIDGTAKDNDDLLQWWASFPFADFGVPVWHLHEPLPRLARLVSEYTRVALGSSGEFSDPGTSRWWNRIAEAMEVACDQQGRPIAKLHGLRMLDPTIFSHIPLASADSTNIARNIGIDSAWRGPYQPMTKEARAAVLADRIEMHASASYWDGSAGVQKNLGLIG